MAVIYIVFALGVVALNFQNIPHVFASIFKGAFSPASVTGGAVGSFFMSMKKGVSRGIFSNEAGLGTGSIAHACADTRKPVKQGLFGIFEVFVDTIVICTLTALVILCSEIPVNYGSAAGAELTILGFTSTYGNLDFYIYGSCNVLFCIFNYYRMGIIWFKMYRIFVGTKGKQAIYACLFIGCNSWSDNGFRTYVEHC